MAILLSGKAHEMPRWAAAWAEQIRQSDFALLEAVITSRGAPPAPQSAAFRLYEKWIGNRLGGLEDPLGRVPVPAGISPTGDFPEPGEIDLLVAVDPPGEHSFKQSCPVWWLHPAQADGRYSGDPPYFWEALDNVPVCGVTLMSQWPGSAAPVVLDEAIVSCDRSIYAARNRVAPFWTGSDMLMDNLRVYREKGREAFPLQEPGHPERPRAGAPVVSDLVPWLLPALGAKAARRLQQQEQLISEWRIALRRGGDLLENPADLSGFRFIAAPPGRFYADPFPVYDGSDCWLFFEDYVVSERKAVLTCGRLSADLRLGEVRVILERPFHLSFPHVFQHLGTWYMIPESNASETLDLYVAEQFPYKWRWKRTLRQGKIVDAAVIAYGGFLWWFVTVIEPRGRGMKLLLFYSESMDGEWHLHPASPLTRDVRKARGAGAILRRGERLYRPAQDCGPRYGYGFRVNEIVELTPERYSEREVFFIEPPWAPGMLGTHTYNRSGDIEAVDANWFVPEAALRA